MAITNGGTKSTPVTYTATTTPGEMLAENPKRRAAIFRNTDASVSAFIGNASVTASSTNKGLELKAGEVIVDRISRDTWYAVTASSTAAISVTEIS